MGNFRKSLSLTVAVVFLVSLIVPLSIAQTAPTWNIQTVDSNFASGIAGICLDSNNNPHIAYVAYENGNPRNPIDVVYASWTGSSWNIQTIIKGDEGSNIHLYNFVLTSNNNPYILFDNDVNGGLLLWNGSNGRMQTVDKEGSTGGFLGLDALGNLHVAYKANLPASEVPSGVVTDDVSALKYASWNGSSWIAQTVESPISYSDNVYLAFDSNNNPLIMYGNETSFLSNGASLSSVKFATWNGTVWNTQTVISNSTIFGNMVLDSKGYPHFIYRQYANNTLSYASWNGSTWSMTVVSNAHFFDINAGFLALDRYDYPQVDFVVNNSLRYAKWTGGIWDIQTVDNNDFISSGPIAVDSMGNPHICYQGGIEVGGYVSRLNYATATEPQPILSPSPTSTLQENSLTNLTPILASIVGILALAIIAVSLLVFRRNRKTNNQALKEKA
jgi:hypothetical protein